jgi:hypothetical protein
MRPVTSVIWALVPLYTLGYGTFAVLGWAAYRLRARRLAVCTAVALLMMVGATIPIPHEWAIAYGWVILFGPIIGGTALTFTVRDRLVRPKSPAKLPPSTPSAPRPVAVDPAIRAALAHRERRAEARRILETDPALARELCIGRPDLPRQYDDGGILDVNHVSATFLAALPGFTPRLATRVVEVRRELDGFTLLSELVVYAGVPEGLAADLADRLVFLA